MYECIIKKQKQLTSYPLFTQLPEVFWKALWKRKQARSLIKIYVNMLIIHLRVKKIMIIARRIANIAYSITCAKLCPTLWDPMDCSPPGLAHWNFPGKKNGVGCHFLLQWIFPTHGSNLRLLCLLHRQVDSLPLSHLTVGLPIGSAVTETGCGSQNSLQRCLCSNTQKLPIYCLTQQKGFCRCDCIKEPEVPWFRNPRSVTVHFWRVRLKCISWIEFVESLFSFRSYFLLNLYLKSEKSFLI